MSKAGIAVLLTEMRHLLLKSVLIEISMDYIKDFFAKFNDGLVPKKPSEDSFYVDPVILEREISEYLNRQTPSERIKELFIIE